MFRKLILALGLLAALVPAAQAQQDTIILPGARATRNLSGSIAVTNTFQSVWGQSNVRVGCVIQNLGANKMWVFFGPIASATQATSIQLAVGQSLNCNVNGIVATDQVSITGTSGDNFYASVDGSAVIEPSSLAPVPAGTATIGNVGVLPVPTGATQESASSGNIAANTAAATLAGAVGKSTYLSAFQVTFGGATAGQCVTGTITGTIATAPSFTVCSPTGVAVQGTPLVVNFTQALVSSAQNTAITVSVPSLGAGNTNTTVTAQGYVQ